MKLKVKLILLLIISTCIFCLNNKANNTDNEYNSILLELGAKYVIKNGANDHTGVFRKGLGRIDVNGWIPPYYNVNGQVCESIKNKVLNWYYKYNYLLDIEKYQKEKNPSHFAIMNFLLDIVIKEKIVFENKDKFIEIALSNIGLEEKILGILVGKITCDDAIKLYKKVYLEIVKNKPNFSRLNFLPEPQANNYKYITFLEKSMTDTSYQLYSRQHFIYLLWKMDKAKYEDIFLDFTMENINTELDDVNRMRMYVKLFETKNIKVLTNAHQYISKEIFTICREFVLAELCELRYVDKKIIDEIYLISIGKGKKHYTICVGCNWYSWIINLIKYLECIKDSDYLPGKYKKKAKKTLRTLRKLRFGNLILYLNYFKISHDYPFPLE